jgi:hypothetical protein
MKRVVLETRCDRCGETETRPIVNGEPYHYPDGWGVVELRAVKEGARDIFAALCPRCRADMLNTIKKEMHHDC